MRDLILDGRQAGLFKPDSDWRPPTELPDLTRMEYVCLDTETRDPELKNDLGSGAYRNDGYVVGICCSWVQEGKAKSLYAPIKHEGGDNLPRENVIAWLNYFFKHFNGTLIFMECMYDLMWLQAESVDISRVMNGEIVIRDIAFLEALINENKRSYSLASNAEAHGFAPKDESLLNEAAHAYGVEPKSGLWVLPARFVGFYGERDAMLPLQIFSKQIKIIRDQKLEKVMELEHSIVPCLMEMKRRGVRVDVAKAEEHRDMFMKEYNKTLAEIKAECGLSIDIFSAPSVAVGFNALSIKYPATKLGRPSFTDDWLSAHPSKIAKMVTYARKQQRAAVTFCEGMVLKKHYKGRVHCNFHPLRSDQGGTVSGRFSSSNPNLQQVPGERDPKMGTLIRSLFLAEEGEKWAAIDWSQAEPRLTVHYAEERGCTRGAEAAARYRNDPATDYHSMVAEMIFGPEWTKKDRKAAKTVNLGLSYGMGGAKLCRSLGFPTIMKEGYNGRQYEAAGPDGEAFLNKYHAEVPFIKELSDYYMNQAQRDGAIRTLSGRLCRFDSWESVRGGRATSYDEACRTHGSSNIKRAFTYCALNRKIQGGSACAMKISMRNLYRAGFVPLITNHDENGLSVANKKAANDAGEIMRNCVKLRVPLNVDIDFGNSWGEAKPIVEDAA